MFDAGVILQKALILKVLILSLSLSLLYIYIYNYININTHVHVYIVFGETTGGVCFFRFQGEELIPTRCI
jgi:hypothetical protein